jgi:group I intron endonuclease
VTIGVYKIELAGRVYVGSSSRSIETRWSQHLYDLRKGGHHSQFLQNAFNKYGEDALQFFILEAIVRPELAIAAEQRWLDELHPEYNTCLVAGSNLGVKHSPEARARMSAAKAGRGSAYVEAAAAAHRGKHLSPEHRAKLSAAQVGKEVSAETRARMSVAQAGRVISPEARVKIGAASLGRRPSLESRAKMSASQTGRKATAETRARLSAARLAWWQRKKLEGACCVEET